MQDLRVIKIYANKIGKPMFADFCLKLVVIRENILNKLAKGEQSICPLLLFIYKSQSHRMEKPLRDSSIAE